MIVYQFAKRTRVLEGNLFNNDTWGELRRVIFDVMQRPAFTGSVLDNESQMILPIQQLFERALIWAILVVQKDNRARPLREKS